MFFYTSLFIASVIAALVILYLYNAVADVGRAVYRAMLPSSKEKLARQIDEPKFSTSINDTPTPWGWGSHATPEKAAQTHPASSPNGTPWGWKGNNNGMRERGQVREYNHSGATQKVTGLDAFVKNNGGPSSADAKRPVVGWPYREEKVEFAGKAYKVTRSVKPRKTNLRNTSTPWGW